MLESLDMVSASTVVEPDRAVTTATSKEPVAEPGCCENVRVGLKIFFLPRMEDGSR